MTIEEVTQERMSALENTSMMSASSHGSSGGGSSSDASSDVITMTELDSSMNNGEEDCVCVALEVSRVTVNTHTSLLNITEDDDDEDDDEVEGIAGRSFLFEDLQEDFPRPETPTPSRCCTEDVVVRNDSNTFLEQMTESFVDALCYNAGEHKHTKVKDPDDPDDLLWEGYRSLLQSDILELLSFGWLPDPEELNLVWRNSRGEVLPFAFCLKSGAPPQSAGRTTATKHPQRLSLRQRALKLRRLREEHTHRASASPLSVVSLRETRSLDQEYREIRSDKQDSLRHHIGLGLEAIPSSEDGYDSDPEQSFEESPVIRAPPPLNLSDLGGLVQETLNVTFDWTWHSPHQTTRPVPVQVWLERGVMLPNQMIEPCLMWKNAFPPSQQRKLHANPSFIRLLNICRILPASDDNNDKAQRVLNRAAYPLARRQDSFVLRTADTNEEYVFSTPDRDNVVTRLKYVVARFATLAVMEDMRTIQKEFCRPMPDSRMLIPDYEQHVPQYADV